MRIRSLFTLVTVALVLSLTMGISSCKKKKEVDLVLKPTMELSTRDTAEVEYLTRTYMDFLKDKKYDAALKMLYYVDKDKKLVPLPQEMYPKMQMSYKLFPVLNYKLENIIFYSERDSQVKCVVEFFEKKEGDTAPNTTSMFFKPVRQEGKWYLTVYDSESNHLPESKIKN